MEETNAVEILHASLAGDGFLGIFDLGVDGQLDGRGELPERFLRGWYQTLLAKANGKNCQLKDSPRLESLSEILEAMAGPTELLGRASPGNYGRGMDWGKVYTRPSKFVESLQSLHHLAAAAHQDRASACGGPKLWDCKPPRSTCNPDWHPSGLPACEHYPY